MATELPKQVAYARIMSDGGQMSFLRATPSRYLHVRIGEKPYRLCAQDDGFSLRLFDESERLHDVFVPDFCGLANEDDAGDDCTFERLYAPLVSAPEEDKVKRMRDELDQLRAHRRKFPHGGKLSQAQWNMAYELTKRYPDGVRFDIVDAQGVQVTQVSVGDSLLVAMKVRGLIAGGPWLLGRVEELQLPYA